MDDNDLIQIRKEKILSFFKKKYNYIIYALLAIVVFISVWIRTRNLSGLRDVTTGNWTLGPDLDPFLFLRWAKYIVEHGSLFAVDTMRYVPLGLPTNQEYLLHPYMIAWFHNMISIFWNVSIEQSAVLYPVFFFALTVIAFFFMTREIFIDFFGNKKASVIAILGALLLSVLPVFLFRSIAGIPEKESAAFFFMFLSIYFYIKSWKLKKAASFIFIFLSGITTAGMAHVWGGFIFLFVIIPASTFIEYLLNKMDKHKYSLYFTWLISSFILMLIIFPGKHSLINIFSSTSTAIAGFVFALLIVDLIIFNTKISVFYSRNKIRIPKRLLSLIITIIYLVIISSLLFGFNYIPDKILDVKNTLTKPANSRLIQTVAENRQPYFPEWAASFGPKIWGIYFSLTIAFIGILYLFYIHIKEIGRKQSYIFVFSLAILILSLSLSSYSPNYLLDGQNLVSQFFLYGGIIQFLFISSHIYLKNIKRDEKLESFNLEMGVVLLFMLAIIGLLSARAASRGILILAPAVSVFFGFMFTKVIFKILSKDDKKPIFTILYIILGFIFLFAFWQFYNESNILANNYYPSQYNQQWQKAMSWVRENTPENAVFAHWWDYGYWIQSIGERATVLDGGNVISYWNHLLGRYVLTSSTEKEALEFLYAHNATNFLIDSTDIGKYGAFSYIGSDENLDRRSDLPVFVKDITRSTQAKNHTNYLFIGGSTVDEDIFYEDENSTKIRLPKANTGIGAIILPVNDKNEVVSSPEVIFVNRGNQIRVPIRYARIDGKTYDFKNGLEAGIFVMPSLSQNGGQIQIDKTGSLIYLSARTVNSNLVRLYLYGEQSNFELVHSQDDFIVESLKSQLPDFDSDFVLFNGVRGPIKIWKINYPGNTEFKPEYLETSYPEVLNEV